MQDFKFDIENNDIVFGSDMVIIDSCSVHQNEANELATRAENQILNDGGRIAEISVQETEESGVYEYELQVVYNSEYKQYGIQS